MKLLLTRRGPAFCPVAAGLLLLLSAGRPAPGLAQTAAPSPGVDLSGPANAGPAAARPALTPEERSRLRAARRAALQDPAVKAAAGSPDHHAFHRALREAMLRADPSLQPVLDKMRAAWHHGEHARHEGWGQRLARLSPEERAKLKAAHRAARRDPAVASARSQVELATDAQQRHQAWLVLRETTKDAMLRADPTVGPILDRLRAP